MDLLPRKIFHRQPVSTLKSRKIRAFTLIEILIVMLILAILFLITILLGANARRQFVSSQLLKEVVVTTRSARRQSMLVTKSAGENWVHAVGVEFTYDSVRQQWKYYTVKLQHVTAGAQSNTFYIPFPTSLAQYGFNRFGEERLVDVNANFVFYRQGTTTRICSTPGSKLRVMFKSINGTPVIYCDATNITSQGGVDIATDISVTKIIVDTDGNISASTSQ